MLANHKGEIPFFTLLIPFMSGLIAGLLFDWANFNPALLYTFLFLTISFVLLNRGFERLSIYRNSWLGGALLHLVLIMGGYVLMANSNELKRTDHFSKLPADRLVICISTEPRLKNNLLRFTANVESAVNDNKAAAVSGNLMVTMRVSATANGLRYGDRVLIPATYKLIDPPFNPAEFNYKRYLANQRIYHQMFIAPGKFLVLNTDAGNPVIAYALKLRSRLVEKLKARMHDPDAIAVASTLILGYKADLSDDVLQAYSRTGTIHVLSVSGAHVGMIFYLLTLIFTFLNRVKYGRTIRAFLIITLIWGYALLTGFSPAVCRAAVMITFFIAGKAYNRHINNLNILAASAFFLLLYDPFLLMDVGFQLSYLAVFGLITLQPVLYRQFDIENKWLDKLWVLCSASIAAQAITFSLSAYYFHQFPVYFLVSNLLIIIPSAVIMYAGVIYLLLPSITWLSETLAYILENSIILMNKVLHYIENVPFASIHLLWFTTAECVLLLLVVVLMFYYLYNKNSSFLKISLVGFLLIIVSTGYKTVNTLRTNEMVFLNLRKHTGIALRSGDKAVVVTDISLNDKTFEYSVKPYLDSCKIDAPEICTLEGSLKNSFVQKHTAIIQFLDKKLFVIGKDIRLPQKSITVDYLLITGTPHINIKTINTRFNYQLLVIDANNSDRYIQQIESEAASLHVNFYTLKRNKALRITSN